MFSIFIKLFHFNEFRQPKNCVHNTFYAWRFVQEHRLPLDRVANHKSIDIALPEEPKNGFSIHSISLIYLTLAYAQKSHVILFPYNKLFTIKSFDIF